MKEYPMEITPRVLEINAHISDDEIATDIRDKRLNAFELPTSTEDRPRSPLSERASPSEGPA